MDKKPGHYLGTEIDEKWWKRYKQDGFFARGNGEYWYDKDTFYFKKYLTQDPIVIPLNKITDIKRGSWHSGRWSWGQPIVKILWNHHGMTLCSGFVLSNTEADSLEIMENLRELVS
jgi:hypothetical protein